MRIRSDLDEEYFRQGFAAVTDPFGKKELADRLTQIFGSLEHGTVSILDGRWGCGKSVFAQQWKYHLENQGIPCIYFDAFASDYIQDPFQAIASAFVRAAKEASSADDQLYDNFLGAAARALKVIGPPAAKLAAKVATLGLLGAAELNQIEGAVAEISSGAGDASEAAAKAILENQADDEVSFAALRGSLESLPDLLARRLQSTTELEKLPLIIIIDELDRCRPDFALGILEVLKHFFRADRLHFVLVTNIDHIIFSVQKRYGAGDEAREYIQKFYDFIFSFESGRRDRQPTSAGFHASRLLSEMLPGADLRDRSDFISSVTKIVSAYDLSLRQAERMVASIVLAQIDFSRNSYRPGLLVGLMSAIKSEDIRLFAEIKSHRIDSDRILNFVKRGNWDEEYVFERLKSMVEYHVLSEIDENDENWRAYGAAIWNFSFRNRLDILPYIANSIIDKFS